jgi:opacity protein-like surface antigen
MGPGPLRSGRGGGNGFFQAPATVTRIAAAWLALVLLAATSGAARAEDSDRARFYLGLRTFDTNPGTGVHDSHGVSLGATLNRYVGVELAGDFWELHPSFRGRGTVGEIGVFSLVPEVRLRYPLFDGRLTPYVIGGAGLAISQFNDRKPRGFGLAVDADRTVAVGAIGGGLEYFIADNLAVGIEVKYLFSGGQSIEIDGVRHANDIDSLLTFLTLRLFYPELRPAPLAESRDDVPVRLYLGVRLGAALLTDDSAFPSIETGKDTGSIGFNWLYGIAVGANFGRYLGAEVAFEGHEVRLAVPGLGSIGEYALYTIMPQVRVRYPLMGGRLQPYALAGVGGSYAEFNDGKPRSANLRIDAKDFTAAGAVGAGIEYFVTSNIAVNFEAKYNVVRGHVVKIEGLSAERGVLDSVYLGFGLRIFLAQFGG